MDRPSRQDLTKKAYIIRPLMDNLTMLDNNYEPTMQEYLANIYVLVNVYEYVTQSLVHKVLEIEPEINIRYLTALKVYRICRDAGVITNSDRNFMTGLRHMRNLYCHSFQDITVYDVHEYTNIFRQYLFKMVKIADNIVGDDCEQIGPYIHIIDLYNKYDIIKYSDILTSAMYTVNRVLTLKECNDIKELYDNKEDNIPNLIRLLTKTKAVTV